MTCVHASRRKAYSENIPRYNDASIRGTIEGNEGVFATGTYAGNHRMQLWRQLYLAEARKRGLK